MRSSLLGLCRRRGALYGHPRRRPLFQQLLSLFVLLLEDGLEHLGDHVQLAVGVRDLQQQKYIMQSEGASGAKMYPEEERLKGNTKRQNTSYSQGW